MPMVERSGAAEYILEGKPLANDDEIELRLGGNRGWMSATISGLPAALRLSWTNDHGQRLQTTVPPEAQLRWP